MSSVVLAPLLLLDLLDADGTPLRAALAALNCAAIPILPDDAGRPRYGIVPALPRLIESGILERYSLTVDQTISATQTEDEPVEAWAERSLPALFQAFGVGFVDPIVLTDSQRRAVQRHPAYRVMDGRYDDGGLFGADCAALGITPAGDTHTARLRDAQSQLRGVMNP